jgi:putative alpha-1,2-mannosidase
VRIDCGLRHTSILRAWVILVVLLPAAYVRPIFALDNTEYGNSVQNKVGFIRYPLGTIGAFSTGSGETADVITRAPRIYPCVKEVVLRPEKEDWRASITGDPSMLTIKYRPDKPSGASAVAITVAPHVTVFQATFPQDATDRNLVVDFRKATVDNWARLYKWTDRVVTRVDDRTFQASVGEPGKKGAFYVVRFSSPCLAWGFIDASGKVTNDAVSMSGAEPCLYARFDAPTVTVAVAESFSSPKQAEAFLTAEFTDFDTVHRRCRTAWNEVLNRVEVQGSENSKHMAYTALYTMVANIIDGSDGGYYAGVYARPRSVASSAYWQFIGGYQSCCWDNVRATYPFLMLAYPEVMSDVVNTYLARYQRDGCMDGDVCLFTGSLGHKNIRFSPVLVAQAYYSGVQADYAKLYAALNDNYHDEAYVSASLWPLGRLTQPASGGFACSRSLEFMTGAHAMALLAKSRNDPEAAQQYLRLSKAYTNLWDADNHAFRLKNADGSWGPIENARMTWNPNPQGLFEGTTRDWMFAVPHDPYGLIHLPGQEGFVQRVVDYCLNDAWFNDYQEIYPYMLYYAGAANEAQSILRNTWVPLFSQGVMYEGVKPKPPHGGWQTHYTGSSGWLLCSMLGLYPGSAPAGQFIISSPSVTRAVIHNGKRDITIETKNNDGENIYVRSIRVDGQVYPAYMIPAQRLVAGVKIDLEMGSDRSAGLGDLYVSSSDGFVRSAELVSASHLKCTIEAAVTDATTKIYGRAKPARVLVNGRQDSTWSYDEVTKTASIQSAGMAEIEIVLRD